MKRISKLTVLIILFSMLSSSVVLAKDNVNTPYYSYTYEEDYSEAVMLPTPYIADTTIRGDVLGIGAFNGVSDVTYDSENKFLYITDSGNHRIVVLDEAFSVYRVLDKFQNNGKEDGFQNPYAVFPKGDFIYVSDTNNNRIVIFNKENYEFVREIRQPEIKLLGEYVFLPKSFAVDLAGRIYVVAQNINEGVVQLDAEGNFERFVGAPDVTLSWSQKIWRLIMTDAQRAKLEKAVPTEYNSIHIDRDGFLYLTTQDTTVPAITKLNCQGDNILRVNTQYNPEGDFVYYNKSGLNRNSHFVDIGVREDGIYAALDSSMGRIFVYDQEGVLLYCFGGNGAQKGTFRSASAIEIDGSNIYVTDQTAGTVTVFTETTFGMAVDKAVTTMLDGQYEDSANYWNKVLEMCPGYNYAYSSLARTDIQKKDYKTALKRLKGESSFTYYDKAFEGARKEFIADNFTAIFVGVFVLVLSFIFIRRLWKKQNISEKLSQYQLVRELKFSNHIMFHPIDGFWDLKREKRGSLKAANVLTALFIILYGVRVQCSGYTFTHQLFEEIDVIFEVIMMVLPLAMWIISNWCFTSLMDGEGTMKDIYIATAYALKPYIITAIPLLILSHCLSGNEAFIYNTFDGIVMVWMLGLIFFGMMITHNYSLGKGVLTAILTLIGICLMMFLILVCFNVLQDMTAFGTDLYKEIIYRMY